MRIAFYSYPSAFQNPGGGEIQLLKTKEALEKKDVEVKLFDQWKDRFEDFDILHVFGSVKDCVGLMETAKNKGTKIALSTIFYSSFKRAMHEGVKVKTKANLLSRHITKLVFPVFPSGRRKTILLADALLPNGKTEARQIKRLFAIKDDKIFIVPNGVDVKFKNADPELFTVRYGFKDFILAVGRIEPRKNQLNLIRAFKRIDKELVIVGDPVSDYIDYYKQCKDLASNNVHFLGSINHEDELLSSAYAACSVFVVPGWFETPGLAALEAALAGAKLAVTKYGCTKEYFLDMAEYFDPSNISDITRAILSAYNKNIKKEELKNHIYQNYTWDKVAEATIHAYKKVLGGGI